MRARTRYEPEQLERYYDRFYFETYAFGQAYRTDNPHWRAFFGNLADAIVAEMRPQSVLDSGCGPGLLVAALRDRGVEAWGMDISEYAIDHVREDVRPFCRIGSAADELDRQYDLIVSVEVLEHLPRHLASRAVAIMSSHTDDILFSSAPSDFGDPSHQNVQPSDYWIGLFGRHGFFRDLGFDASFISRHAVRLRRVGEPTLDVIRSYERWYSRTLEQLKEMRSINVGIVEDRARLTAEVERLSAEVERLRRLVRPEESDEAKRLKAALRAAEAELADFRGLAQGRMWRLASTLVGIRARLRRGRSTAI